jgi:D-serine deaminase-like pyridoxal phosphate-dependent protein
VTLLERRSALIGLSKAELDTPALLIDGDLLEANLERGGRDFTKNGLSYRPHAKTHKSAVIARKQLEHGAVGIACAKLGEAEVLAGAGLEDILVTTPVVGAAKIHRLVELSGSARVAVVVDDPGNAAEIGSVAARAGRMLELLVEVDVGQERCGVRTPGAAVRLAELIEESPGVRFRGLQGYQGGSQGIRSFRERVESVNRSAEMLQAVVEQLVRAGLVAEVLTGGGTGSSPIDVGAGCLTELQPGSYVFMDSSYAEVEWTPEGDRSPYARSLSVLTAVISRSSPHRVVVDAGQKAASSDSGSPVLKDRHGARFSFAGDEHGIVEFTEGAAPLLGEKIELYPSHCDTTVNLHDEFVVTRRDIVEDVWPIDARGKMQ